MTRWLERAAVAGVFAVLLALSLRTVAHADFWWQWRTGAVVVQHGPPHVDAFSYTRTGRPWIELRWLFCSLLYGIVELFGAGGVSALPLASFGIALAMAARAAPTGPGAAITSAVLLLAVLASSQRFVARPELVTYAMLAAYTLIIMRWRRRGGWGLFVLPLLQVVWTNAHTTFVLGPVVLALLLATEAVEARWPSLVQLNGAARPARPIRASAAALALVLAACVLNPYGWRGAVFPVQLFEQIRGTVLKSLISEFRGPLEFAAAFDALRWHLALVCLAGVVLVAGIRRLDVFLTLLCGAMFYLSTLAVRNLPMFAIAAVPFILAHAARAPTITWPPLRRALPAARVVLCIAVLAVCAWYVHNIATDRYSTRQSDAARAGLGLAGARYPAAALDFVKQRAPAARVFAPIFESAYLLAHDTPVFADPRLEVYGPAFFERYTRVLSDPTAWRDAVDEFQIQAALVDLPSSVVSLLRSAPRWRLVYFDETAAVFFRDDVAAELPSIASAADAAPLFDAIRARLPEPADWASLGPLDRASSPVPFVALARFALAMGFYAEASTFARAAVRAYPNSPSAIETAARALDVSGDAAGAIAAFETLRSFAPLGPSAALRLAQLYAAAQRPTDARAVLQSAVRHHATVAALWAELANLQFALRDAAAAEVSLDQAARLAPNDATYRHGLAKLRLAQGKRAAAIADFRAAHAAAPDNVDVCVDLAKVLIAQGEIAEARTVVACIRAIDPRRRDLADLEARLAPMESP